MKIEQRKYSTRHTFTFNQDSLNFAYNDKTGSGDVDHAYADIPRKTSIRIDQNTWLRNVGYLWCALGVIQIGLALASGGALAGTGFWLIVGVGCLVWAHLTKVKYTVFAADGGAVWVIQDGKDHDRIIDEIFARRKSQLLAWYGTIDLENGLDKETQKIRWLVEQQALTFEEGERRIAQVRAALGNASLAPPATLN